MADPATIVRTYIEMWNETDPHRRRELVSETLTDDASYLDPIMAGNGVEEISEMIGAAQAQYPGHRFEPDGSGPSRAGRAGSGCAAVARRGAARRSGRARQRAGWRWCRRPRVERSAEGVGAQLPPR